MKLSKRVSPPDEIGHFSKFRTCVPPSYLVQPREGRLALLYLGRTFPVETWQGAFIPLVLGDSACCTSLAPEPSRVHDSFLVDGLIFVGVFLAPGTFLCVRVYVRKLHFGCRFFHVGTPPLKRENSEYLQPTETQNPRQMQGSSSSWIFSSRVIIHSCWK